MTARRRRMLTSDEVALWAHVTRHVAPLGDGKGPKDAAEPAPAVAPSAPGPHQAPSAETRPAPGKFRKPAWQTPVAAAKSAPEPTPGPAAPPPLAPLERRLRQRLSRGSHPIDSVIDLHGMRQEEAHAALRSFLRSAQAQGHGVVLVVTGKGSASMGGGFLAEERGVLRRNVPHWLRMADLRPLVVGFEEAVQQHGGGGALYVRIRRARGPA
jgi:DNA-nicking Smr family endonuclease